MHTWAEARATPWAQAGLTCGHRAGWPTCRRFHYCVHILYKTPFPLFLWRRGALRLTASPDAAGPELLNTEGEGGSGLVPCSMQRWWGRWPWCWGVGVGRATGPCVCDTKQEYSPRPEAALKMSGHTIHGNTLNTEKLHKNWGQYLQGPCRVLTITNPFYN